MSVKLRYECSSDYLQHREHIFDLHKRGYDTVSESLYDSLYLKNPCGDPLLGLCYDGTKLVGQENYIRQDIASGTTRYKGAIGINTLVDANYRLLYGVFGHLGKLTLEAMNHQVDILCTFPNEESKIYYLKYFQWQLATRICVYKKLLHYSPYHPKALLSFLKPGRLFVEVKLEEVNQFDSNLLDPLLLCYFQQSQNSYFYKTTEFLNWKYINNTHYPVRAYCIYHYDNLSGYCITFNANNKLKILDLLIANNDRVILQKTLSSLAYIAKRQGMSVLTIWASRGCWYEQILKKLLFIERDQFDILIHDLSKNRLNSDWVIHAGDFDNF